jgi:hypothetical protein
MALPLPQIDTDKEGAIVRNRATVHQIRIHFPIGPVATMQASACGGLECRLAGILKSS